MKLTDQILSKLALVSPGNGRDYIKTNDGEIYSINGLYCDKDGNIDRYGKWVRIIDIRWSVVIWRDCYVGMREDFSYITERRLVFTGDKQDEQILTRYGYRVERDKDGNANVREL